MADRIFTGDSDKRKAEEEENERPLALKEEHENVRFKHLS